MAVIAGRVDVRFVWPFVSAPNGTFFRELALVVSVGSCSKALCVQKKKEMQEVIDYVCTS